MADRDSNSMQARNWKKADVSAVLSHSVKSKSDNVELFSAIKEVVADAVKAIRGGVDDDKYRNIVDLIMMRVRAVVKASQTDVDAQSVVDGVSQSIDEKLKTAGQQTGEFQFSDKQLAEIAAAVVDAVKAKIPEQETQTAGESPAVQTTAQQEPSRAAKEPSGSQPQYANLLGDINAQIQQLDDLVKANIGKIESTYGKDSADLDAFQDIALDVLSGLEDVINKGEEINKQIVARIQSIGAGAGQALEKAATNSKSAKELRKQLQAVRGFIDEKFHATQVKITDVNDGISKRIADQNKVLEGIIDRLDKSKMSMTTILLIVGLVGAIVIPLIWPLIKGFLDKIDFEGMIDKVLENAGKAWEKVKELAQPVLDKVWENIKSSITGMISSPIDYVVERFKGAWNALVSWKDDIWGWITGKKKEVAKKQDQNEKKAEQKVSSQLEQNLQKTENMMADSDKRVNQQLEATDKNIQQTVQTTDQANKAQAQQIQNELQNTTASIEQTASQAVENVNTETTKIAENVQNASDDINSNTLPQMQKDLADRQDSGIDSVNQGVDGAIKKAEQKADDELEKIEQKAKEEGPHTNVTTDQLNKLDRAGEGADLSGGIDKKPTMPKTTSKIVVDDNGKDKDMYSKKADNDKLMQMQSQSEDLAKAGTPDAPANITGPNSPDLKGKIVVQADSPDFTKGKPEEFRDLLTSADNIEAVFKQGNTLLKTVLGSVDNYFKDLNGCIEMLGKKKPEEKVPDAMIVAPGSGDNVMADNNK